MYSELYTLGEKVQYLKIYVVLFMSKGLNLFDFFFGTEARTDQKGPEECTQNLKNII